jgi:hypothetical protein
MAGSEAVVHDGGRAFKTSKQAERLLSESHEARSKESHRCVSIDRTSDGIDASDNWIAVEDQG